MDESMWLGDPWRQGGGAPRLAPRHLHAAALGMRVARRAIRGTVPADFVHDPALDMLLGLYLARPAPMAAADLVTETTVSHLVAMHWIEALRTEGLLATAGGMVALSEAGLAAVETMLTAVVRSQQSLLGRGDH